MSDTTTQAEPYPPAAADPAYRFDAAQVASLFFEGHEAVAKAGRDLDLCLLGYARTCMDVGEALEYGRPASLALTRRRNARDLLVRMLLRYDDAVVAALRQGPPR